MSSNPFFHLCQVSNKGIEEASVGVELGHIPHHDTGEAGEVLGVLESSAELVSGDVTGTSGTSAGGDAEQELDVLVGGGVLGPVVPDVEVEGVLGGSSGGVVGGLAPVVVELDHDKVESDRVEGGVVSRVREDALRSSSEVVLLVTTGVGGVHQGAELLGEGVNVVDGVLEVKVETVDDSSAEGTSVNVATSDRSEPFPDVVGLGLSIIGRGEATSSVSGTTNGEGDGLASLLASNDVLLDLGALEEAAIQLSAGVAGAGEVDIGGRADTVHEGNGDDVNVCVLAVGGETVLRVILASRVLAPVDSNVVLLGGIEASHGGSSNSENAGSSEERRNHFD